MKRKSQQRQVDPPDPEAEETRAFWREIGKEQIKSSINSIDESAKQMIGVTTVLEGLYFNAITFSKLQGKVTGGLPLVIYLAPIVLLLVSLSSALFIFVPFYYQLNIHSSEGSRSTHEQIIKRKMLLRLISSIFLVLSVLALFLAVLTYLRG